MRSKEVFGLLQDEMRFGAPAEPKAQRKGRQKLAAMPPSSFVDDDSQDRNYCGSGSPENRRTTRAAARKSHMVSPLATGPIEQDASPGNSVPPSPTETLHPLAEMQSDEVDETNSDTSTPPSTAHAPMSASPSLVMQPGGLRNITMHAELAKRPLSVWEKMFFVAVLCPLGFTVAEQLLRQGVEKFGDLRAMSRESAERLVVLDRILDEHIVPVEHMAIAGMRWAVRFGAEIAALGLAVGLFTLWRRRRWSRQVVVEC